MKQQIMAFAALTCAAIVPVYKIQACSICGCAASGNFLGILPQYQKHFLGIRYNYRSFHTTHPASIIPGLSGRKSREIFHSAELAARFCPSKRWQVLGILPYQILEQNVAGASNSKTGIGDGQVMAYYSLISGEIKDQKKWRHLLQSGFGLKLPTGYHTAENLQESEYNPAFQLGTGSWDKMLSIIYTASNSKFGINSDITVALNGTNKEQYRFGNRISGSVRAFYSLKRCKSAYLFQLGAYAEHSGIDLLKNKTQSNSGGNLIMPVVGVDRYSDHLGIGINYRMSAYDQMQGGYVKSNGRLLASVYYLF